MTIITTELDQLNALFEEWDKALSYYSLVVISTKMMQKSDPDNVENIYNNMHINKSDILVLKKISYKLSSICSDLRDEIEHNLMSIIHNEQGVLYLKKLANSVNNIDSFFQIDYNNYLDYILSVNFIFNKSENNENEEEGGDRVLMQDEFGNEYFATMYAEGVYLNKYLDKYLVDEEYFSENTKERIIILIDNGKQIFINAKKVLLDFITSSTFYNDYSELIKLNDNFSSDEPNKSLELNKPEKGLTALQKLLFIRLLQKADLFPRKPINSDEASELKAIALLTGLSYKNNLKGGAGATKKVNELLDDHLRKNLTNQQAKEKLKDLTAVEEAARLLNTFSVIDQIEKYRKDLEKILLK
ncbi:hypothetical protein GCM10027299_52360 [Larkinella ripae]